MGAVMNDRRARLIDWQRDVLTDGGRSAFLQRLVECGDINEVACDLDLPPTLVLAFVASHRDLDASAKSAIEKYAHRLVAETIEIADAPAATLEDGSVDTGDIAHRKLKNDTRFKAAKVYHPAMYGDNRRVQVEVLGDFGERLRRARERVIEPPREVLPPRETQPEIVVEPVREVPVL